MYPPRNPGPVRPRSPVDPLSPVDPVAPVAPVRPPGPVVPVAPVRPVSVTDNACCVRRKVAPISTGVHTLSCTPQLYCDEHTMWILYSYIN